MTTNLQKKNTNMSLINVTEARYQKLLYNHLQAWFNKRKISLIKRCINVRVNIKVLYFYRNSSMIKPPMFHGITRRRSVCLNGCFCPAQVSCHIWKNENMIVVSKVDFSVHLFYKISKGTNITVNLMNILWPNLNLFY